MSSVDPDPLAAPVFPTVAASRGHYESFYLRAAAPERRAAVWIRYTVHKPPGGAPRGSVWCTLWDGERPHAVKQTFSALGTGGLIEVGPAALGLTAARGEAADLGHSGAWELSWGGGTGAVRHLPRGWLYRSPLPRTKTLSPVSNARFHGWVEVDAHRVDVDGWRGMIGHNWGSEHAERWIWLHATDPEREAWIDCVAGRVKVGRWTTPWVAGGVLCHGGRRTRLGGLAGARRTVVAESPESARLSIPTEDGWPVIVELRSPEGATTAWSYADPAGGEHQSLHCSVAAMQVRRSAASDSELILTSPEGAAYELGVRERDHGIPLQPFPDG